MAANCAGTIVVATLRFTSSGSYALGEAVVAREMATACLAGRFHPATVLLFLAMQMDRLAVVALWDNEALGSSVVAFSMASAGLSVGAAFYEVLLPHFARVADAGAQATLLARGVRHATLLLAVLAAASVCLSVLLLGVLGRALRTERPLACWSFLRGRCLEHDRHSRLRGVGDGRPGTIAAGISVGAFLLVSWPLGAAFGLTGVAGALGLANSPAADTWPCTFGGAISWACGSSGDSTEPPAGELWQATGGRVIAARRRLEAPVAP